jgi:hypothetical protein
VDPDVADHIKREAGSLIPPRSAEHVNLLRKVGEYAYDLLADVRVEDRDALPYMTQVASMLGGSLGVKLLERISEGLSPHLDNKEFTNILIRLWPEFDLIEFADHLLARRDIRYLEANSPEMLRAISRVPSVEILECQLPSDFTDYTILAKMPRLSKATILVSPDQRGLSIATFPSRPREVMLMNWTPKAFYNRYSYERQVSSTPAYRTLTISRLDALPLLRSLALGDNFEELVIQGDGGIADLRDLSLPPSIVALEVTECPSFSQLDGVAELAGSQLRDLRVEIGQSMTSLTGLTQPLFWVTEINDDPLIKQLRLLKISFVDSSSINTQELDMLKSNISGYGFTVDGDGHSGITAQR